MQEKEEQMKATSGSILPGGIVLMDEPAGVGIATFKPNGEVLMTFNARPGGTVGQVIIGLSPNQVLQLIDRLYAYDDVYARAIAEGKGGARFTEQDKADKKNPRAL